MPPFKLFLHFTIIKVCLSSQGACDVLSSADLLWFLHLLVLVLVYVCKTWFVVSRTVVVSISMLCNTERCLNQISWKQWRKSKWVVARDSFHDSFQAGCNVWATPCAARGKGNWRLFEAEDGRCPELLERESNTLLKAGRKNLHQHEKHKSELLQHLFGLFFGSDDKIFNSKNYYVHMFIYLYLCSTSSGL